MRFTKWLPLLGALLLGLTPFSAYAVNVIGQGGLVGVCDPKYPQNCAAPTSGGSIPTNVTPATGVPTVGGAVVGTSSTAVVAAGTYSYVFVQNVSATALVACRWGGTAILNDVNSFMLVPYGSKVYEGSYAPSATALNCIASGAATPVYAEVK